jgi:ABC-2 type transport system permease protein
MPKTTSNPEPAPAPAPGTGGLLRRLRGLSFARVLAVLAKELIQLRRDRLTFGMIVGVPVMQLVLFGYAINADPKQLPTALVALDQGPLVRSIVSSVENTRYFRLQPVATESQAEAMIARGDAQFAFVIPADFSTRLLRGERPALAVYADATDPAATGSAIAALARLPEVALAHDLTGPLAARAPGQAPFELRLHRRYNPEGVTAYNVVPGLMGVILTMTLVMMTSMAMTRERERGTLENLLATPVRPLEMMIGKILPYVLIGYTQVVIVLAAALLLFAVPLVGGLVLLFTGLTLFMLATLCVGFTFSTLARSQMQSMQMTMFFFLPNILLSGFMFPFRGMPAWAQWLGEALPLTHFLRVVRAVMLKGAGFGDVAHELWPIGAFIAVVGTIALRRYRQTLD